MAQDEVIVALCEKSLVASLRDFLGKQPGVKHVPAITVAYRDARVVSGSDVRSGSDLRDSVRSD